MNKTENITSINQTDIPAVNSGKIDNVKNAVADNLTRAAEVLHDKSDSTINVAKEKLDLAAQYGQKATDKVSRLGHKAADMLDTSAEYVRDFEPQKVKETIQTQFREHPGTSLLIAGTVGFIIGAIIARRI